jgi:hypothetical protein
VTWQAEAPDEWVCAWAAWLRDVPQEGLAFPAPADYYAAVIRHHAAPHCSAGSGVKWCVINEHYVLLIMLCQSNELTKLFRCWPLYALQHYPGSLLTLDGPCQLLSVTSTSHLNIKAY